MAKKSSTPTEIDPRERLEQLATEIENAEQEATEIYADLWNSEKPTEQLVRKYQATRAAIVDLYRAAGRLANDLVASTQGTIDGLEAKFADAAAAHAEAIEKAKAIMIEAGCGPETIRLPGGERLIDHNPLNAEARFAKSAALHVSVQPARERLEAVRDELDAAQSEQSHHRQNREAIRQRIGQEWNAAIGSAK